MISYLKGLLQSKQKSYMYPIQMRHINGSMITLILMCLKKLYLKFLSISKYLMDRLMINPTENIALMQ